MLATSINRRVACALGNVQCTNEHHITRRLQLQRYFCIGNEDLHRKRPDDDGDGDGRITVHSW